MKLPFQDSIRNYFYAETNNWCIGPRSPRHQPSLKGSTAVSKHYFGGFGGLLFILPSRNKAQQWNIGLVITFAPA
jgi:hypothetical protein